MIASNAPTTSSMSAVETENGLPVSMVSAKRFEQHGERVDRRKCFRLWLIAELGDGEHGFIARFRPAYAAEDVHAPEHRRGANRRQQAGRATGELHQCRAGVARIGRRLLRIKPRIHRGDRPAQTDQGVDHMQPGAGHAAAGRFARVVAPAAFHPRRVLVGEMAFDVQHLADRAAGHHPLELAHRREAALIVAEAERHAGLGAGGNGACRFRARERQRLFAPHRLAG